MKDGYQYRTIKDDTFHDLFILLDDEWAALREDCIEYTVFYPDKPLVCYPDWYINAFDNGMIFEDEDGNFLFCDNPGDMKMRPGSVMMINFLGQLKNMDRTDFEKYYDVRGFKQ